MIKPSLCAVNREHPPQGNYSLHAIGSSDFKFYVQFNQKYKNECKSLGFVLDSTKSIDDDLGHVLISKTNQGRWKA